MNSELLENGEFAKLFKTLNLSEKKDEKAEKVADDMVSKVEKTIEDVNDDDADDTDSEELYQGFHNTVVKTDPKHKKLHWDYKRILDYIYIAYMDKRAMMIYGDPGIGKSEMVQQFYVAMGKKKGRKPADWNKLTIEQQREVISNPKDWFLFIDVRAGSLTPGDLEGIPDMDNKEEWLETKSPKWLYVMGQPDSDGILFLDEVNNAPLPVIQGLYTLLDRKVGPIFLSKDFGIFAAANLGDEFGGTPLPPAFVNRFLEGVLTADPDAWLEFAREHGVDRRIISFIEANPEEHFNPKPKAGHSLTSGEQWASPRAIMAVSKGLKNIERNMKEAKRMGIKLTTSPAQQVIDLATGLCGESWAISFNNYLKHFALFNFEEIAKKAENNELVAEKKDKMHAMMVFVMGKLKGAILRASKNNGEIIDQDRGYFIGFAKIINAFKPEWKAIAWTEIKRMLNSDSTLMKIPIAFLLRAEYDAKTKKRFTEETLPIITKIMSEK